MATHALIVSAPRLQTGALRLPAPVPVGPGLACSADVTKVYIGYVEISPAMASKIQSKHGVTPHEVRDACAGHLMTRWHVHEEYGRRLLVVGRTDGGRLLKVILQPVDESDGTWRLRTVLVATGLGGT